MMIELDYVNDGAISLLMRKRLPANALLAKRGFCLSGVCVALRVAGARLDQTSPSGSGPSSAATGVGALSAAAFTRPTHKTAAIVTDTATQPTVP